MPNDFARHLRMNMTDAEQRLGSTLRHRQICGWKFRRQAPIGPFIGDFVCFKKKLIIELDGSQHADRVVKDSQRTDWLTSQGFRVLRFWNHQVFEELEEIREAIWRALGATPHLEYGGNSTADTPHPNPPPQGGRE